MLCRESFKNSIFNPFKAQWNFQLLSIGPVHSVLRVVVWFFFFHFYSNFNGTFCKQRVETLIRSGILQHRRHILLIWFCTVCLSPTKRMQGLYGLVILEYALKIYSFEHRCKYSLCPHASQLSLYPISFRMDQNFLSYELILSGIGFNVH